MTLTWKRATPDFQYQTYNRDHTWKFDGGHEMEATAAPAYLGNPKFVDPEEAFVASSELPHAHCSSPSPAKRSSCSTNTSMRRSCHMEKNRERQAGHYAEWNCIRSFKFSGEKQPTEQELDEMHHFAHAECFIANSVKTTVTVEK